MIKYESKRVKNYNLNWERKLLKDMKDRGIMYGLIVTEVMPKDKNTPLWLMEIFGCKFDQFLHTTSLILELFNQIYKRDQINSIDKSEARNILNHIASTSFAHTINSIVNNYYEKRDQLDLRERTFNKDIAKERITNDNLFKSIVEMYTGLEAVSNNMPKIKGIENDISPSLKLIN